MQAWAGIDESLLDVLPSNFRNVNLLPDRRTNWLSDPLPHPMSLAHAKLEVANLKADIAQSSTIRAIQLSPVPDPGESILPTRLGGELVVDSIKRAFRPPPAIAGIAGVLDHGRQIMDRHAQGTMQWADYFQKLQEMSPLAAKENFLSKELAVVEFQATTKSAMPTQTENH